MGTFSRILGKKEDAAPGHEFSGSDTVSLTIDERRSSRLITETKDGTKCVILLERGLIVRGGTVLGDEDGSLLLVEAAPEEVSTVRANSPLELTRLAYHLGNRHVPLEITSDYLRYQHDHVLDDMVRGSAGQSRRSRPPLSLRTEPTATTIIMTGMITIMSITTIMMMTIMSTITTITTTST